MQYADESLRPDARNEDEAAADRFVDWYGQQIGVEPCLLERPDKTKQGGIDGEYQLGKIRLLIEHTSLDELPNKRTEDDAFRIVTEAFNNVCLPEEDCIYDLSLPYGYPTRQNAQKVAKELRAWFDAYAHQYHEEKGRPRVKPASNCFHPLNICVWRSGRGAGRVNWGRRDALDTHSRELAKTGLRQIIITCLKRKLPKLLNHPATASHLRILILQNDEIWRGFKTDYAKFVRGYFHRHGNHICDEVWSLELGGDEMDCILLWCKSLDKTTSKNPFRVDALSLLQLLNIRKLTWQKLRLSQVQNAPEHQIILTLLQKGLDARGYLDEGDERQLDELLCLLYKQSAVSSTW